jgi:hypothetical protein
MTVKPVWQRLLVLSDGHILKKFPPIFPLPWWEGVRGRGSPISSNIRYSLIVFATPTLTLPHQGGGNKKVPFLNILTRHNTRENPEAPGLANYPLHISSTWP